MRQESVESIRTEAVMRVFYYILFAFILFLNSPISQAAQNIQTDPFLRQSLAEKHWQPGGMHYAPSGSQGTVVPGSQSGQVYINPGASVNLGSFSLENAIIRGRYDFSVQAKSSSGGNQSGGGGNNAGIGNGGLGGIGDGDTTHSGSTSNKHKDAQGSQSGYSINWQTNVKRPYNKENHSVIITGVASGAYFTPSNHEFELPTNTINKIGEYGTPGYQSGVNAMNDFAFSSSYRDRQDAVIRLVYSAIQTDWNILTGLGNDAVAGAKKQAQAGYLRGINAMEQYAFAKTTSEQAKALVGLTNAGFEVYYSPTNGAISGLAGDDLLIVSDGISYVARGVTDLSVGYFTDSKTIEEQYSKVNTAAGIGDFISNNQEYFELAQNIIDISPGKIGKIDNNGHTLHFDRTNKYRDNFFDANPTLAKNKDNYIIHHTVELAIDKRFPEVANLFTQQEIDSAKFLRAIPKDMNGEIHLSIIRNEWNKFYDKFESLNMSPTREDILAKVAEIDKMFLDPTSTLPLYISQQ